MNQIEFLLRLRIVDALAVQAGVLSHQRCADAFSSHIFCPLKENSESSGHRFSLLIVQTGHVWQTEFLSWV
jgi:hypothetical protein